MAFCRLVSQTCPSCRSSISMDDVNVSTDLALCRSCGKTFSFAEVVTGTAKAGPDLNDPPKGAWFEQNPDGFRLGGTTRSWMAIFLIPFTCVWAGGSIGDIYGKQIQSGHFDGASALFGLPFLLGSFVLVTGCVMMTFGKIEISRKGEYLLIFTGVGKVGWMRSFLWSDFTSVREDGGRAGFNKQQQKVVLEGKRRAAFGSMLSEERRYFVLSALRRMIQYKNRAPTSPIIQPVFR